MSDGRVRDFLNTSMSHKKVGQQNVVKISNSLGQS